MQTLRIPLGAGPMQASGLFNTDDPRGKYGLIHNIGIGGAVVCTLLRRPEFYRSGEQDGRSRYVAYVFRRLVRIMSNGPWQAGLQSRARV